MKSRRFKSHARCATSRSHSSVRMMMKRKVNLSCTCKSAASLWSAETAVMKYRQVRMAMRRRKVNERASVWLAWNHNQIVSRSKPLVWHTGSTLSCLTWSPCAARKRTRYLTVTDVTWWRPSSSVNPRVVAMKNHWTFARNATTSFSHSSFIKSPR